MVLAFMTCMEMYGNGPMTDGVHFQMFTQTQTAKPDRSTEQTEAAHLLNTLLKCPQSGPIEMHQMRL